MEILNSRQMEKADRFAIENIGIPSAVLMENASRAIAEEFFDLECEKESSAVVCGSGNNGGDGFTAARMLINKGFNPDIYILGDPKKLKGDAKVNYDILINFGADIIRIEDEDDIPDFSKYDIIIDAIFGTGLSREAEGIFADVIDAVNDSESIVISVDIPSGLSGMTHNIIGTCIDADVTVTFCRAKLPHVMYPAKKFCGDVVIADISIPDFAVDEAGAQTYLVTSENLPVSAYREEDSHKGDFGHAVIIGGSFGKGGAGVMAGMSCMRTGAGLTTLIMPDEALKSSPLPPEIMSLSVQEGGFFTAESAEKVASALEDKSAFAVGPGLGRNEATEEFVLSVLKNTEIPVVVDADGLYNLQKGGTEYLRGRGVITPHIGEFARLLDTDVDTVLENRLELASEYAAKHDIVVVLKSADTIIALPEGERFISVSGTPALAKGGSGDCLTGLIVSFISQGYSTEDSAKAGAYFLGRAGEIAAEETNENCVLTTDVIDSIWKVFDEVEKSI